MAPLSPSRRPGVTPKIGGNSLQLLAAAHGAGEAEGGLGERATRQEKVATRDRHIPCHSFLPAWSRELGELLHRLTLSLSSLQIPTPDLGAISLRYFL